MKGTTIIELNSLQFDSFPYSKGCYSDPHCIYEMKTSQIQKCIASLDVQQCTVKAMFFDVNIETFATQPKEKYKDLIEQYYTFQQMPLQKDNFERL